MNAVCGAGATVLPAVDDQCLILAREWQRLCSEPWTLANACLRVNEAIDRVGFDAVRLELEGLRQKGKRPSRFTILDVLDGLLPELLDDEELKSFPAPCDLKGPSEWQEICRIISHADVPGCRHPRIWLSQIRASITGNMIELNAINQCVRDTTRHHLMAVIRAVAERKGLQVTDISCMN